MEVNIYGINGCEIYNISLSELEKEIAMKKNKYISTYRSMPKFIKLPCWIFEWARVFAFDYVCVEKGTTDITLFGFICCPTTSIQKLEDIELF